VTIAVALASASKLTLEAVTVAAAVSVPGLVDMTTIVIVTLLPAPRLPTPGGAGSWPASRLRCVVE
jgi:hypothetical protein